MATKQLDEYWRIAPVYIAGIDRVGYLHERGRVMEARDHFISSARAVWTWRWTSVRDYRLCRLGEALDIERYPELAEIAAALRTEEPGAAGRFLEYLRGRAAPDADFFTLPPDASLDPSGNHRVSQVWQGWAGTGDARFKAALDERIAEFLHPERVISWHETNWPWAQLVCSALCYGGVDDETLCRLILFGLYHAEQCNTVVHLSDPPQTSIGGNHLFNFMMGWLSFAVLFPEFRRTPALLRAVVSRLDDELSLQVTPDGAMIEGAPGYHNCCLYGARKFLDLCTHYGVELPDTTMVAWRKMLDLAVALQKPDGRAPMFGDSQDDDTAHYVGSLKDYFPSPAVRWTATRGEEGQPPAYTSIALKNIGYYVMRDSWEPDALYLCLDGGRFGQSHHHEDKLNFELSAYGRPFIVDPGVHSYSDHWFRGWSVLSQAHNTLDIDGVGQCRWRQDRNLWYSHTPLDNRWETSAAWDIVEATFDGPYEREIGPIIQTRRIVFHRGEPGFWWITDFIDGPGTHEVTEFFHFAHDLDVVPLENGARTSNPGANLALLCLTEGVETHCYRGEEDPRRGWVSPKLNTVEPAWEVHFTGQSQLPLRRDFLLLPWQAGIPEDVETAFTPADNKLALHVAGNVYEFILPQ
ncbi:MAG: heparinase II/III family protein [Armatimonadota bacterium]